MTTNFNPKHWLTMADKEQKEVERQAILEKHRQENPEWEKKWEEKRHALRKKQMQEREEHERKWKKGGGKTDVLRWNSTIRTGWNTNASGKK
jgi:hypothetical protein